LNPKERSKLSCSLEVTAGSISIAISAPFCAFRGGKPRRNVAPQPLELRFVEKRRRPAAEVELRKPPAAPELRSDELHFEPQMFEVFIRTSRIFGDHDVASAKRAALRAKRDVEIERKRLTLEP
jgi:hypothetical protein